MKALVEFIAKSLVDHPDEVSVTEIESDHELICQITVAEQDMGRIIGKQGRIAKAIRTVTKAAATKKGIKVQVNILE